MYFKNLIHSALFTSIASLAALALAAAANAQQTKPAADEFPQVAAPRTSDVDAPFKTGENLPAPSRLERSLDLSSVHVQAADDGSFYALAATTRLTLPAPA